MTEENCKITPFMQEQIETYKKVKDYKVNCEANIVSCIYKNPNLIHNVNLKINEFSHNIWRVYYQIAYDIVLREFKDVLDDITVGLYLEKHNKLKEKFNEYGGYGTIESACGYVQTSNFNGYVDELRKWNVVIELCKKGFPVKDNLSHYVDCTAEEIYSEFEALLNDTFVNVDSEIKSYDICYKIDELIEKMDKGMFIGMPYYNIPTLTQETGGQVLGNITLVGGLSNVGKSTFCRTITIPEIIKNDEKIIIMVNEDSYEKWQRELLVWICNNIFNFDIQKYVVRNGNYTKEVKNALLKSAEWLKENTKNHTVTIIPFNSYQTQKAIKVIKKFANMGVKYFLLDTFKMDSGRVNENSWLAMQQSMVDIFDTVKSESLNVHILITFQLNKGSVHQRYYTQDNIGMAKNIVDPVSTCIMIRDVYDDEYAGESKELKVYRLDGKNKRTKIEVTLDKNKRYQILFLVKNREGAANTYQIVLEHDLSRNIINEIGITQVLPDF